MKLTLLRQNIVRGSVISVLLAVKIAFGRALPPIYFGRADSLERTLLRVACQSETFLAPPWQGSVDIRVLWYIGCQSEFEERFRLTTRISFRIYRNTGFPPEPLSTCRFKGFVEEELYESQHRTMPLFHIKPNVKEVPFRTSKTPSENREAFLGIQARYFVKSSENVVYLFVLQIYAAGLQ